MTHNFADWNTTVLFDNTDISKTCNYNDNTLYIVVDEEGEEDVIILDDRACYSIKDCVKDNGYLDSREVITWEDIRLYLLSKGYEYWIYPFDFIHDESKRLYSVTIQKYNLSKEDNYNDKITLTDFESYEEARKVAITYCLNLINNGHNTINT